MKRTSALAALAASLLATTANSTPIQFEFSGDVQVVSTGYEDWVGQLATGRFLIETDNFTVLSASPSQVTWTDVLPFNARPAPITASISIGADTIFLNSEVETYGGIHFAGSCEPFCNPGATENWGISANTQSFPLGGQRGAGGYSLSSLAFYSSGEPDADFIPGSGLTPLDILTLPLGNIRGVYNYWDYICADGQCSQSNYINAQFEVDSLTRSVVETRGVPEPGTLGLLGVALAGMFFLRRRRLALLQARD